MKDDMRELIDRISVTENISESQLNQILKCRDKESIEYLHTKARMIADKIYGKEIYIRGLIEFTNYCKNDCYYCGIRRSNRNADRYRLTEDEILDCCKEGYELGFRTFVLQGGEDPYYNDDRICDVVRKIKDRFPDCAITLSIGEKSKESYQKYYDAGANRYLLRHETANDEHYRKLHPKEMKLDERMNCLWNLKDIGYQVGCGFMVGSPGQTIHTLYDDLMFIKELKPHMVGIGPYISQKDTPFGNQKNGSVEDTLRLLSIIRLIHPSVLLPSTTALGTIDPKGREKGILAGGNVVMPNLSPTNVRKKYALYDNKICTGDESAQCKHCLQLRMIGIGYETVVSRGDSKVI